MFETSTLSYVIIHNGVLQLLHEWVDVMSREFKHLMVWPDHQMIGKPFHGVLSIACSETFIEGTTSPSAAMKLP